MKHFVLDTNVLIHDPARDPLSSPTTKSSSRSSSSRRSTIQEGGLRARAQRARGGAHARRAAGRGGALSDGSRCPSGGGRVRVASAARSVPTTLRESQIADHLILMVALDVRDCNKGEPTIFVTKDVNLRIRADALGLTSMDFEAEQIDIDELYSGMTELPVPGADVDTFYAQNTLALPDARPARRTSTSCCATATTRRTARSGASTPPARSWCRCEAARRRVGHPAAQQGAALRARSAPVRRDQAGHADRQGRHRQDAAGAGRRPAEGGRGADLHEAAGLAADLPAGPRRRLPARRHRGEAEPLDAADLRQRRVPDGPLQDRSARTGAATRS